MICTDKLWTVWLAVRTLLSLFKGPAAASGRALSFQFLCAHLMQDPCGYFTSWETAQCCMPTFVRIRPSVQAGCGLDLTLNGVALFRKWSICCPVLILAAGTTHTVAYLLKVWTLQTRQIRAFTVSALLQQPPLSCNLKQELSIENYIYCI